jgi:HD superfamily phosphohydrolase YqeK
MSDSDDARHLLRQAQTCRRLAIHANDDDIAMRLTALAEDYEAKAAARGSAPGNFQLKKPKQ